MPDELQVAYYRVLAHTRGLSPDLLTRHTPKDIADERERLRELLEAHQQHSEQAQQNVLGYVRELESRLADLPGEIEAGLDPKQISEMLGESLRQNFLRSGVQDTVSALKSTSAAMTSAQKELSTALRILSDSHGGVVAQVERANNRIEYSLESRAKTMDALLHEWKSDLLRVWIPLVIGASWHVWRHGNTGLPRHACGYTTNYSGSANDSVCFSSSSGKDSKHTKGQRQGIENE